MGSTAKQTRSSDELRRQARHYLDTSLALAIGRYLRDHADAPAEARSWLDEDERSQLDLGISEFERSATSNLEELEALMSELDERGDRELGDELRIELVHAKLNFQSARSGSFETAVGSLGDFLRDAGESPDDLSIH